MNALHLLRLVTFSLLTDRTIHAGASTSGLAMWGGHELSIATINQAQQWIAFYASVVGALGATATFVYVCIKIARLVRNPKATE